MEIDISSRGQWPLHNAHSLTVTGTKYGAGRTVEKFVDNSGPGLWRGLDRARRRAARRIYRPSLPALQSILRWDGHWPQVGWPLAAGGTAAGRRWDGRWPRGGHAVQISFAEANLHKSRPFCCRMCPTLA